MKDETIAAALAQDGFVFLSAQSAMERLPADLVTRAWDQFAQSWNDLGEDLYMADGGRYRRRRHAVFELTDDLVRAPAQPHYQSRDYNPLNGGVERWFDPVSEKVGDSDVLKALSALARSFIALETGTVAPPLQMEMHQFRIEARPGTEGLPTPEGMHRDGVDWVMVVMVNRSNVKEGETRLTGPDRRSLGAFTLSDPLDMVFLDDWRVFHGVTPIRPLDPSRPGARDVLVLTFRRLSGEETA